MSKNELELEITPNYPYEVEPLTAEEMGAFIEDALFIEDIEEAIEGEI